MASEPKNEQGLRVAPLLDGSAACTDPADMHYQLLAERMRHH